MPPTTFSIEVEVLTPDRLKLIKFKLKKELVEVKDILDLDQDNNREEMVINTHWTLTFSFTERKKDTDPFPTQANVSLTADISKSLEAKSQETIEKGFDSKQRSALQAAYEKYKLWKQNKISEKVFNSAMNNVISRRGA